MKRLWLPLAFCSLAGCLTLTPPNKTAPAAPDAAPAAKSLKAQEQAEQAALSSLMKSVQTPKLAKENYQIAPSDLIEITVFREEELNRAVRVNQDGEVSFPLVGTVKVGGMSVIAAEKSIASKLADYLKNPQVTIFVKEYSARQIYVLGEVKNPGAFPLPTESLLSVLEAISLAGGFTPVAAQDRTRVIRNAADGSTNNITIPVSAITKSGDKSKDLPLQTNDVVFVPQSLF